MSEKLRYLLLLCLFSVVVLTIGCGANDETVSKYPEKTITIIVPYTAGGSADLIARSMEGVSIKYFKHPLVVNNIPGASAMLGWNELAGSNPDGYTIGYTTTSLILQPLYGDTRYHYATAIDPLARSVSPNHEFTWTVGCPL